MNLIERISAKTPRRNKIIGHILGSIGTICATVLSTGLIVNPILVILLSIGSALLVPAIGQHSRVI